MSVDDVDDNYIPPLSKGPDAKGKNLGERSLRREAKRERLMRQMELEEAGGIIGGDDAVGNNNSLRGATVYNGDRWGHGKQQQKSTFPPDFLSMPKK